ncbi:putative baseplate assembly protein [Methylobacter marinus]|uniref:putative baseplate assembly protein n=1 Tax=Methylobacter marinus TaxID=34058 RepID=UPI000363E9C1|nr:putative baseplate assembly protein [Methylobacter marinus]
MNNTQCTSSAPAHCATEKRRALIRGHNTKPCAKKLAGLDYVEVDPSGTSLVVHFFGTVPETLSARNVVIEGGRRIRDIKILSAQFVQHGDGDTCLHVRIDKAGDFSSYCICLIEPVEATAHCLGDPSSVIERKIPEGIDTRYACAPLLFRTDCPSTVDCKPQPCSPEPLLPPPTINYLARDFQSFRQLMLDRLLVTMPEWRERHIPDIGITLVELMAYVADQLSYTLDAVATEAYLATARLRISVRRHARLVDYRMHEGCNSRAWVCIDSDSDQTFDITDLAFAVPPNDAVVRMSGLIDWDSLRKMPDAIVFEAMDIHGTGKVSVIAAHSEIHFYTWGDAECCLPAGTTRASLLNEPLVKVASPATMSADDSNRLVDSKCRDMTSEQESSYSLSKVQVPANSQTDSETGSAGMKHTNTISAASDGRFLQLNKGDVLIMEEIRGPRTGAVADADPSKRHVVRLTWVSPSPTIDPITGSSVLEVEWGHEDALPFTLCLSTRTDAPNCEFVETAVARGNVILVDHGITLDDEVNESWVVQAEPLIGCCGCEGAVVDVPMVAKPFSMTLAKLLLTHVEVLDPDRVGTLSALGLLKQDPRKAVASVKLDDGLPISTSKLDSSALETEKPYETSSVSTKPVWRNKWDWISKEDLLSSLSTDRHFVVEMDDEGFAHLRFGDDDCGRQPEPGLHFRARYRIGNSTTGNVGRDAIVWLARRSGLLSGIQLRLRNPLPAAGGMEPEPVSHVKLYAPHAYSRVLERAVAASDYAELAGRDARIDSTYSELAWTGSWYEANVALDPFAKAEWDTSLAKDIIKQLERARRIGHDFRIVPAHKVPLVIGLNICVAPHYSRSDVELAIREVLSNRRLANGTLGLFHPDNLEFGTDIKASRIVAAVQKLEGVLYVEITEFRMQDADPNTIGAIGTLADNFISIRRGEIAQLDNDQNFPENGSLKLTMKGGL